jgi:hypothetical protein
VIVVVGLTLDESRALELMLEQALIGLPVDSVQWHKMYLIQEKVRLARKKWMDELSNPE